MKENKFILICVVCLIVFCKFWMLFAEPWRNPATSSTISVTEQTSTTVKKSENKNVEVSEAKYVESKNADTKVATKAEVKTENVKTATVQPESIKPVEKAFSGCGSSFSSDMVANTINGKTVREYRATNVITCDCIVTDGIIEKTVVYRYSGNPKNVEMDCHSKCGEICGAK